MVSTCDTQTPNKEFAEHLSCTHNAAISISCGFSTDLLLSFLSLVFSEAKPFISPCNQQHCWHRIVNSLLPVSKCTKFEWLFHHILLLTAVALTYVPTYDSHTCFSSMWGSLRLDPIKCLLQIAPQSTYSYLASNLVIINIKRLQ